MKSSSWSKKSFPLKAAPDENAAALFPGILKQISKKMFVSEKEAE